MWVGRQCSRNYCQRIEKRKKLKEMRTISETSITTLMAQRLEL